MKNRKWTKEEIEFLVSNKQKMTYIEISKAINRSVYSISSKCSELGLLRVKKWTEEEIIFLKENINKLTYADMAKKLKRTEDSIKNKCYSIGIYNPQPDIWKKDEENFLAENISKLTYEEMAVKLNRTVGSISSKCSRLGLKRRNDLKSKEYEKISNEICKDKRWYYFSRPRNENGTRPRIINYDNWISYKELKMRGKLIDWQNSIGCKMEFSYNGLNGVLEIKEYNKNKKRVTIKYSNYPEYEIATTSLQECSLGKYLNKIIIQLPELVTYLKDPKDSEKFTYKANKKTMFKCFDCGGKYEKSISDASYELIKNGKPSCKYCSDGISSYTKFVISILMQLNIDYIREVNESTEGYEWLSNGDKKWRYDLVIREYPDIFWEIDGKQHDYKNIGQRMFIDDYEIVKNTIHNDEEKEKHISEHEKVLNRITFYNDKTLEEYKSTILNSSLPSVLGFCENDIDWNKVWSFCQNSFIKQSWDLWEEYKKNEVEFPVLKISKIIGVSPGTIRIYLKNGSKIGKCSYDSKEESIKSGKRAGKKLGICIIAICPNGKEYEYYSASEASRKSREELGVYCSQTCISRAVKGEYGSSHMYKGIIFYEKGKGYDETKVKDVSCKKPIIATYKGIDYKFDSTVDCVNGFFNEFNIKIEAGNVSNCLRGKRKSTGGITFRYNNENDIR